MANMPAQESLIMYPLSTYTFGQKAAVVEKHGSVPVRMERLKEKYALEGIRRSVDAVLLVHAHNHPHILLLQLGSTFFKLPGGRLRPGEDEATGLMRKLNKALAPEKDSMKPDWRLGDLLATFYRPNFENFLYPYCPPHIERPKEVRSLYLVHLPEQCFFSVPQNQKLLAVPLFEIYDHMSRYGPLISAVPQLLSRYALRLIRPDGGVAAAPGAVTTQPPRAAPEAASGGPTRGTDNGSVDASGPLGNGEAQAGGRVPQEQPPAPPSEFMVDFDD
ncbi:hypothetical protein ACKKBG_A31685 [Auxenochlorella protothecoides x Auxenochlorella symbiontica]